MTRITLKLAAAIAALVTIGSVTQAGAATVKAPVNWTEATCHAAVEYQSHGTTYALDRLITAAAHLPKSYLKADVLQLAADASSPRAQAGYIDTDRQYVYEDCNNGYGS